MNKLILCVLDGWGVTQDSPYDAIHLAHKPNWTFLEANYSSCQLQTSGLFVGLPEGQMGNSEVGHLTLGAGRVAKHDLVRVDDAITSHSIQTHARFKEFVDKVKEHKGICHLMGLFSPGGIHSHSDHLLYFSKVLQELDIACKYHLFLDGRDTPPQAALQYLQALKEVNPEIYYNIQTLSGRYYAMDRDNRWDRIEKAYDSIVLGKGHSFKDPLSYVQENYLNNITDEFIEPGFLEAYQGMEERDGLFFFNYRADRARQILRALLKENFEDFKRNKTVHLSSAVGLNDYAQDLTPHIKALFPKEDIIFTLGEVISNAGLNQLRIAETEKYAHVTFFFNGGKDISFNGEDRILIPSPKVSTYDMSPEMGAFDITTSLIQELENKHYDFMLVNYANADMVGHTGNLEASIKAIEAIDQCLGRLYRACQNHGYDLVITADHGNAECMFDQEKSVPMTSHTMGPVPFLWVPCDRGRKLRLSNGTLADVAPTVLEIMGLHTPSIMTGRRLINRES